MFIGVGCLLQKLYRLMAADYFGWRIPLPVPRNLHATVRESGCDARGCPCKPQARATQRIRLVSQSTSQLLAMNRADILISNWCVRLERRYRTFRGHLFIQSTAAQYQYSSRAAIMYIAYARDAMEDRLQLSKSTTADRVSRGVRQYS